MVEVGAPLLVAKLNIQPAVSSFNDASLTVLASLRERPEFEACETREGLWIRVDSSKARDALRTLSMIASIEIFRLDSKERLIPQGKAVPDRLLPNDLNWAPLREITSLVFPHSTPVTSSRSCFPEPMCLTWCRAKEDRVPGAILCAYSDWEAFVLNNYKHKWQSMRFAISLESCSKGSSLDTIVVGASIPSIRGIRLASKDRILIPVSHTWEPNVSTAAIRKASKVNDQDWLFWPSESELTVIRDEDFVVTTRVNVRVSNPNRACGDFEHPREKSG